MENNNENLKNSNSENSSFFEQKVSSSNGLEGLRFKEFSSKIQYLKFEKTIKLYRGSSPRPIIKYITKAPHGVNWIKIGDMPENGNFVANISERITPEGAKKSRKVEIGDIILSNSMSFGKPYIMGVAGYIHDGWFVIREFEKYFDKEYLCQLLVSPFVQNQYKKLAAGGVVLNISSDLVNSVNVPIISIVEQKKIANFLSLIDKRIEKQRQLVESLKKYKRGLISKIFEQSCKNGEIVKLEAIGNFYNGLSGKNKEDFGIGDDIFITYMNVYKNVVADSNMCDKVKIKTNESQNEVQYGDILFTQSSETLEEVGFSSVWLSKQTAYLNSFCFGFRLLDLDNVDPVFISYYMRTNNIRKLIMREGQGTTRVNLSSERLKQIKIELPRINIQKQIANIMLKTDERINMSKQIVFALTNMKQGLLQQMFI